jgi:Uma2 family endonuclease
MMVALPDRLLMSADEYLAWESTQEERYEYWDGEVVLMSGGTKKHNRVSFNCSKALDRILVNRDCEVYINDIKVQVEANRKYFYPDVVVSCDVRDQDIQLVQYPCLIVEVLSPSTEAFDRGIKFSRYRQFETLREYVLIQPEQPMVEVFSRNDAGKWELAEYGLADRIDLASIGGSIAVKDLYERVTFGPMTAGSPEQTRPDSLFAERLS